MAKLTAPSEATVLEPEPEPDAVDDVARAMVAAGRVVPGLSVEPDGRRDPCRMKWSRYAAASP